MIHSQQSLRHVIMTIQDSKLHNGIGRPRKNSAQGNPRLTGLCAVALETANMERIFIIAKMIVLLLRKL